MIKDLQCITFNKSFFTYAFGELTSFSQLFLLHNFRMYSIRYQLTLNAICGFRYGSIWKGCLTLYSGKGGEIHKIGEYVTEIADLMILDGF